MSFIVRAGTRGRIVHNNGEIQDWFVRKDLEFSSAELVKLEGISQDEIAFSRSGYSLILPKNSARLSQEIKDKIHEGLRLLAGVCDGALKHDTVGFNGTDTRYGHILASASFLSTKMALDGARILPKYRRQLPPEVVELARSLAPKSVSSREASSE